MAIPLPVARLSLQLLYGTDSLLERSLLERDDSPWGRADWISTLPTEPMIHFHLMIWSEASYGADNWTSTLKYDNYYYIVRVGHSEKSKPRVTFLDIKSVKNGEGAADRRRIGFELELSDMVIYTHWKIMLFEDLISIVVGNSVHLPRGGLQCARGEKRITFFVMMSLIQIENKLPIFVTLKYSRSFAQFVSSLAKTQ